MTSNITTSDAECCYAECSIFVL